MWQSIETAPKNGTIVLLWGGEPDDTGLDEFNNIGKWERPRPLSAWWDGDDWRFCSFDSGYYGCYDGPTHWAPLPEPPEIVVTEHLAFNGTQKEYEALYFNRD